MDAETVCVSPSRQKTEVRSQWPEDRIISVSRLSIQNSKLSVAIRLLLLTAYYLLSSTLRLPTSDFRPLSSDFCLVSLRYPDHSFDKGLPVDIYKRLLPISWEKGFKGSRIRGFKCLFSKFLYRFGNVFNIAALGKF